MKDQTYAVLAALFCVALAVAGIYYLTADTPIWNDWNSDEQSTTEAPSPSSGKQIDERIPRDGSAPAVETSPSEAAPDSVAPPKSGSPASPASGKELTDRIPETEG